VLEVCVVDDSSCSSCSLRKRCALKGARITACSDSTWTFCFSPHCANSSAASASAYAMNASFHSSN
jgi:hypothetical protein